MPDNPPDPPAEYVGYPRSRSYQRPGVYGSAERLEALRDAMRAVIYLCVCSFYSTLVLLGSGLIPSIGLRVAGLAVLGIAPGLIVYRCFAKLWIAKASSGPAG